LNPLNKIPRYATDFKENRITTEDSYAVCCVSGAVFVVQKRNGLFCTSFDKVTYAMYAEGRL
jgi:hypothetical protein